MRAAVAVILCMALGGCLAVPTQTTYSTPGKPTEIAPGETRRERVLELLGEPAEQTPDGRFALFGYERAREWMIWAGVVPVFNTAESRFLLLVAYRKDGTVDEIEPYRCEGGDRVCAAQQRLCGVLVAMGRSAAAEPYCGATVVEYERRQPELIAALHEAVTRGDLDAARRVLAAGASVDGADGRGATPLLAAAKRGDGPMAALLLEAGAEPNVRDKYDASPLHWAVRSGDEGLVAALLAHGAQADTTAQVLSGGVRRPTPLGTAVHGHELAIAMRLVGAPDAQRAVVHGDELEEAVESGQTEMVAALLGSAPKTLAMRPAMLVAVSRSESALVERLLAAGAEADAFNEFGRTVLTLAARNDDLPVMHLLIDAGATIDAPDDSGATPLHHAIRKDALGAAQVLLDAGANPSLRAHNGKTPLEEAKKSRQAEVGRLLGRAAN